MSDLYGSSTRCALFYVLWLLSVKCRIVILFQDINLILDILEFSWVRICACVCMYVLVCMYLRVSLNQNTPYIQVQMHIYVCVWEYNVMLKNSLKVPKCQQMIHWKLQWLSFSGCAQETLISLVLICWSSLSWFLYENFKSSHVTLKLF